jgi:hypothetical protein
MPARVRERSSHSHTDRIEREKQSKAIVSGIHGLHAHEAWPAGLVPKRKWSHEHVERNRVPSCTFTFGARMDGGIGSDCSS